NRGGKPCRNRNAIAYEGSFSFYGGGSFIACSQSNPNMLSGFFQVRRSYRFVDGSTSATLTRGAFSATASLDNVVELVFSDAAHLLRSERARTRSVGEAVDLVPQLLDGSRLDASHHRHDESVVRLDRDAEVVAVEIDDLVAFQPRVQLGEFAQRGGCRLQDQRE